MKQKSNADMMEEDARAKGIFQESEPGTAFILMTPREEAGDRPSLLQRCRNALAKLFRIRRDDER